MSAGATGAGRAPPEQAAPRQLTPRSRYRKSTKAKLRRHNWGGGKMPRDLGFARGLYRGKLRLTSGQRSRRQRSAAYRAGRHHAGGGQYRGRCRRLTRGLGAADASGAPAPRFASSWRPSPRRTSLPRGAGAGFRRGSRTAGWTCHAATAPPDRGRPASEKGAVQVAQVMIPQVPHRLPQIRLGGRAEDLRRGPLRLRALGAEQDATPPDGVFGAAHREANVYRLSVEANRRQVVDDRVSCS